MNDLTHEINDSNYIIFHDKDSEGVVIQNIVLSKYCTKISFPSIPSQSKGKFTHQK
jgi:hypothetical protein